MLYEVLIIMASNILIKSFDRTIHKMSLLIWTICKNERISNNCQDMFEGESIFV